jgi:glucan 1,3-beta-glucosidase
VIDVARALYPLTWVLSLAISTGPGRCGRGNCPSSTTAPAVVYFPAGYVGLTEHFTSTYARICRKYLVSSPIVPWYYTQLIGDARTPPSLVASASFSGGWVIDADPYLGENLQWYANQNNLYVVRRGSACLLEY